MRYDNPLVVSFPLKGRSSAVTVDGDTMTVGPSARMADVRKALYPALGGHDYVLLDFPDGSAGNDYQRRHTNMVEGAIRSATFKSRRPVVEVYDGRAYMTGGIDFKTDRRKPIPDDEVISRHGSATTSDWQRYQASALDTICRLNGLSDAHKTLLTDPSRGLGEEDLAQFHDWKSNQPISPHVVGGDMVGVPGIACRTADHQFHRDGKLVADGARALMTSGYSGIAIPMRNVDGVSPRFQIMVDPTPMTVRLKMKSPEGDTITRGDYMDRAKQSYTLTMDDGRPAGLACVGADLDHITFKDAKGEFRCHLKEDILPTLRERGYDIPTDTVASVKPQIGAKYSWLSPGDMVGDAKEVGSLPQDERERLREAFHDELGGLSDRDLATCDRKVRDLVSPAQDGFVRVRDPQRGNGYVAVVCEGALKGVIAGKYLTVPDANGKTAADAIAGPSAGVVLVQVPGVAGAFMRTAEPIYDGVTSSKGEPGHVVGTLVAMDADGARNRMVARGVAGAERTLSEFGNGHVSVLCWDPEQKGLDDALLSVAHGEHTVDDIGFRFGTASKLFPVERAQWPQSRHMDGTVISYEEMRASHGGTPSRDAAVSAPGTPSIEPGQAPRDAGTTAAGATVPGETATPTANHACVHAFLSWDGPSAFDDPSKPSADARDATLSMVDRHVQLHTTGTGDLGLMAGGRRLRLDDGSPNPSVSVGRDGTLLAFVRDRGQAPHAVTVSPDGLEVTHHPVTDTLKVARDFDTIMTIAPKDYHDTGHPSFSVAVQPGHEIAMDSSEPYPVLTDDGMPIVRFDGIDPDITSNATESTLDSVTSGISISRTRANEGSIGFDTEPERDLSLAAEPEADEAGTEPRRPRRLADFDDDDDAGLDGPTLDM